MKMSLWAQAHRLQLFSVKYLFGEAQIYLEEACSRRLFHSCTIFEAWIKDLAEKYEI